MASGTIKVDIPSNEVINVASETILENLTIIRFGKIRILRCSFKNLADGDNLSGEIVPNNDRPKYAITEDHATLDGNSLRVEVRTDGSIYCYKPSGEPSNPNAWVVSTYFTN